MLWLFDSVHTTPKKFENASLFLRWGPLPTLIRHEMELSGENALQTINGRNSKTPAFRFRLDGKHFEKEAFGKRCCHDWVAKNSLGNLSTRVFETRTVAGSELLSLLTCPHTTTFTLLSIFSALEMSSIKKLGDNTVLACEIFSSGCRPRLKNARA